MRIVKYLLFCNLVCFVSIAAAATVQITDNKQKKVGISPVLQESKNYELACWQNGQRIVDEKGFGSISLGDELLRSSITLRSSKDSGETTIIVGMQKAICSVRGQ